MPYPNEHSARIHNPGEFSSFARESIAPGIDVMLGIKKGVSKTQAYRFAKDKFSAEQAKAWLKEHSVKYISFEPAEGTNDTGDKSIKAKTLDMSMRIDLPEKREYTDEGYLIAPVRFMKPGIMEYYGHQLNADLDPMKIYKVYQDTAVVFAKDTIASFENKPFVNEHPKKDGDVNSETWTQTACGFIRDVHRDKEDYLCATAIITDKDTISEIEGGKKELSAGYDAENVPRNELKENSIPKDVDFVRVKIKGNHVALVDKGRAGHECRILDEEEDMEELKKMLEAIQASLAKLLEMEQAEVDAAKPKEDEGDDKAKDEAKLKLDADMKAKDDKIAALTKENDEFKKQLAPEAVEKKAEDRALVIDAALDLFPALEHKGKGLKAIMIETLKSVHADHGELIDSLLGHKDALTTDSTGEDLIKKAFDAVVIVSGENTFGKSFVKEQKVSDADKNADGKPEDVGRKLMELHNVHAKKQ